MRYARICNAGLHIVSSAYFGANGGGEAMTDQDLPYNYTDKQGQPFTVWAGSEAEAWRLAKAESNYRDDAYHAEQQARYDRIHVIVDQLANASHKRTIEAITAGTGKNGLRGAEARDYCLPDDGSYLVCTAQPGGGSQSTSGGASTEPKEGYTCSGFLAAAVMLFILCGLASGCVAWLEEIAP
jgi:hypothetical protein